LEGEVAAKVSAACTTVSSRIESAINREQSFESAPISGQVEGRGQAAGLSRFSGVFCVDIDVQSKSRS
jgi:hypothetical protein